MSLGPTGASLDPEQAENFEDVCHDHSDADKSANIAIDGEAICSQRLENLVFGTCWKRSLASNPAWPD